MLKKSIEESSWNYQKKRNYQACDYAMQLLIILYVVIWNHGQFQIIKWHRYFIEPLEKKDEVFT